MHMPEDFWALIILIIFVEIVNTFLSSVQKILKTVRLSVLCKFNFKKFSYIVWQSLVKI